MNRPIIDVLIALTVLTIIGLAIVSYVALLGSAEFRLTERLLESVNEQPAPVLWRSSR